MKGYILSVLGVVIVGILVDVIIPSGTINKYIKSVYSIFIVMVIISPVIMFINNHKEFKFDYTDYQISSSLLNYLNNQKILSMQNEITKKAEQNGIKGLVVDIKYSLEKDNLTINSCIIDVHNMEISSDKQHINKYEIITKIVKEVTNINDEGIVFYE